MDKISPDLDFDLSTITAHRMDDFFQAARENDNQTLAMIFAEVVTRCPADWGEPNDPDTYLKLPYFGAFKDVLQAMVAELNGGN